MLRDFQNYKKVNLSTSPFCSFISKFRHKNSSDKKFPRTFESNRANNDFLLRNCDKNDTIGWYDRFEDHIKICPKRRGREFESTRVEEFYFFIYCNILLNLANFCSPDFFLPMYNVIIKICPIKSQSVL